MDWHHDHQLVNCSPPHPGPISLTVNVAQLHHAGLPRLVLHSPDFSPTFPGAATRLLDRQRFQTGDGLIQIGGWLHDRGKG